MSRENVEVVRRFYESSTSGSRLIGLIGDSHSTNPPGWKRCSISLTLRRDWVFSSETFRGRERLLQAVAACLETVSDWRVAVEELIDESRDRVLMIGRVVARGKGSGTAIHEPIFVAVTVRNGKVARIEDHTERARAPEAVNVMKKGPPG
jgi:ketosteroid isomerase-like protein